LFTMGAMATTERPLRADAERNRQRILAAAAEVFAERGLEVSLDDIAHAAGVGVGTVYRRFPSKDDLVDALFESKIGAVEAAAHAALAIEDPWDGFAHFLREACRLHAQDSAMKDVLLAGECGRERVAHARSRIAPLAMQVVKRAQDAGALRADLGAFDMPMMQLMVATAAQRTRDVTPDYWQRMVTILLDGLRAHRDDVTPMPVPALGPEAFVAAMAPRPKR
jgi:AcrR family transcriptional regulator